nr:hypothetical protein [Tanacetum cinerariifolium]
MRCLLRSACLGSLSLTQSLNSLVLEKGLEIRDNHLCAIKEHLGDCEWSRPVGLKLARENLQSKIKEEDPITNVKNVSEVHNCNASRPSKLCAEARSHEEFQLGCRWWGALSLQPPRQPHEINALNVKNLPNLDGILRHLVLLRNLSLTLTSITRFDQVVGITVDCGPVKIRVKHLFGGVVRAVMSPDGSIVARLKNINGFLAVNTPLNDLINTNFEQERVIPKVMLHIFEEFVLLLGRHSRNNEVPRMVVCKVGKPWGFNTLFGEEEQSIFFKKTGHRPGYLQKILYESWIEADMTKETTNTLDVSRIRQRLVTRAKVVVAKVGTSSSTPAISSDIAELKDMVKALLLDKKNQSPAPTPSTTPAPVKAVELSCVTYG